jgi:hypothetical protein
VLPTLVESAGMFVNWHLSASEISSTRISLRLITFIRKEEHTFCFAPCRLLQFLNHRLIYYPILGTSISNAYVFWVWIGVIWWVVPDVSKDRISLFLLHCLKPKMKTVWSFGIFGKPSPSNTTACTRRPVSKASSLWGPIISVLRAFHVLRHISENLKLMTKQS